jgi:hypothetical protein
VRQTVQCHDGTKRSFIKRDALIMTSCAHNLTSLGKLARDEGISTTLGAGDSPSFLAFADGGRAPLLNLGIVVIPPGDGVAVPALAAGVTLTVQWCMLVAITP